MSCDEPSHFQFAPRWIATIDRFLLRDPVGNFGDAFAEILARNEAELPFGFRNVGETMPDIAGARLAGDFRRNVAPHRGGECRGDVEDRPGFAAADVVDLARRARMFEGGDESLGDVRHMDEIAPLLAVFEDERRLAV